MRVLVVDDEAPARLRIRTLLRKVPGIDALAECENGTEAVSQIRALTPDLLFLDVQMPGLDGFGVLQALSELERPRAIIFVTAYDRYAVRAFDESATDYLLKPYSEERFFAALERVRGRLMNRPETDSGIELLLSALAKQTPKEERLVLRSRDGVQFVDIDEIDWLQGAGNYTLLHLGPNQLRIRETVSELDLRLSRHGFIRIHRSIIVNGERIWRIEPWGSGEYVIFLRNGTKIQSSRKYGEQLRQLFA